jgi:hypothetical protein
MWTTQAVQCESCGFPIEVQVSAHASAEDAGKLCKACEAMHVAAGTPYFERAEQESKDARKRMGLE